MTDRETRSNINFLSEDPDSVVSAREMVTAFASRRGIPLAELSLERLALVTFTTFDLREFTKRGLKVRKMRAWGNRSNRVYREDGWIVVQSPYGAPNAVMLLEELVAFGVKRVVYLGYCGSLQERVEVGDIVIPTEAVREEGTSYHYVQAGRRSLPDPEVQGRLFSWMRGSNATSHQGKVWTTDAPYRETPEKVIHYRREGILGVEMEMAAVFAVGMTRNVSIGSLLIVSDAVSEMGWRIGFFSSALKGARKKAIEMLRCRLKEMVPP